MTDNVKEIRWGRVIDGRVVEVLDEADDGHPAAWFHEDTLHEWQIIPNDQQQTNSNNTSSNNQINTIIQILVPMGYFKKDPSMECLV
jgi:hypothetical protein